MIILNERNLRIELTKLEHILERSHYYINGYLRKQKN